MNIQQKIYLKKLELEFGGKNCVNYDTIKIAVRLCKSYITQIHTIMLLTYLASFTGYEDDYFKVISNLHVQSPKFEGIFFTNLAENLLKN